MKSNFKKMTPADNLFLFFHQCFFVGSIDTLKLMCW